MPEEIPPAEGRVQAEPAQAEAAASTDFWDSNQTVAFPVAAHGSGIVAEQVAEVHEEETGRTAVIEPAAEAGESANVEATAGAGTRKGRARKPAKTGQRRASTRRKAKESPRAGTS